MSSSTNINVVLSQGTAVNEIQNIRKQSLDLNQQYVAQHAEIRKKEVKAKIVESNAGSNVEIGKENDRKNTNKQRQEQKNSSKETVENDLIPSNEHIIDITV